MQIACCCVSCNGCNAALDFFSFSFFSSFFFGIRKLQRLKAWLPINLLPKLAKLVCRLTLLLLLSLMMMLMLLLLLLPVFNVIVTKNMTLIKSGSNWFMAGLKFVVVGC